MFGKVPSIRGELSDNVSFDFGATELSESVQRVWHLLLITTAWESNEHVSVESAVLLVGGDFYLWVMSKVIPTYDRMGWEKILVGTVAQRGDPSPRRSVKYHSTRDECNSPSE